MVDKILGTFFCIMQSNTTLPQCTAWNWTRELSPHTKNKTVSAKSEHFNWNSWYQWAIFTLFLIGFQSLSPTVNYDMSTAKELLLLTNSQEEQQRWVSHLLKRIPRKHPTMSSPPAVQNNPPEATARSPPRVSPRPSPRSSPHMSAHRGAIKIQPSRQQQPSGKPRWGWGKFYWIQKIFEFVTHI